LSGLAINFAFLSAKPSGISNYGINLLPHLRQLSPQVFCSSSASVSLGNLTADLACHPVSAKMSTDCGATGHLKRLIWTQLKLPRLCNQIEADLLFSPLPEAPLYSGCRYVVTIHDLIPLRFGGRFSRLANYFRIVLPQILAQSQHILVNSEATATELVDIFQISSDKISVTPLAFASSHFRWLDIPKQNYFLYLGRHDRHKNLVALIQAFSSIPTDYHLYLAGSSDRRYTPELVALVKELNLESRVKFLDYIAYDQLPILLNQAIALVLPSWWEGFGLPALEAMGCGTPVIASNLGALPEVVGDAGIMIDPYDVSAIAAAMRSLIEDPSISKELQILGLNRAKRFSWQNTGDLTVSALSQFL
jgi:glycosyltransferase involved in cell wall biosynthesis